MNANNNNQANGTKNCQSSFDEAPAGWNTRYLDPNGFECQITIRVKNDSELLEITANAIAYLLAKTCTPSVCCRNGARPIDSKSIEQKKKMKEKIMEMVTKIMALHHPGAPLSYSPQV
jgi:hypothetical protein